MLVTGEMILRLCPLLVPEGVLIPVTNNYLFSRNEDKECRSSPNLYR